jgi:hypothetical protein
MHRLLANVRESPYARADFQLRVGYFRREA